MTSIVRYFTAIIDWIKHPLHRSYNSVVFLDFDGVLAPITDATEDARDGYGVKFNAECAKNLNSLIKATNAKIVITSSWRQYLSLWRLRRMWRQRNMLGEIVGVIPIMSIYRGNEIDEWLKKTDLCIT